jgi:hypothetical protein
VATIEASVMMIMMMMMMMMMIMMMMTTHFSTVPSALARVCSATRLFCSDQAVATIEASVIIIIMMMVMMMMMMMMMIMMVMMMMTTTTHLSTVPSALASVCSATRLLCSDQAVATIEASVMISTENEYTR